MAKGHVVLFIDGSTRPNPGPSGWGAHGFYYEEFSAQPRKLGDRYLVESGYCLKNEVSNFPNGCVKALDIFDFCVFEPDCTTNNLAELLALLRSMRYFAEYELASFSVYTDSEYVTRALEKYLDTWAANNWIRNNNEPIAHQTQWKEVMELRDIFKIRHIDFKVTWVKGHSEDIGNNLAHLLANIAVLKGTNGETDYQDYRKVRFEDYKNEVPEKHPFLAFRRMYFNSSQIEDYGRYFIAETEDKEESFGGRTTEAAYGVIHLKNPDPVLESIKTRQRTVSKEFTCTVMLKLDRVYDKTIYPYLSYYGPNCLTPPVLRVNNLNFIDDRNITYEMVPAGLSMRAMESFAVMENILMNFSQNKLPDIYHTSDITHYFYDQNGKLKTEISVGFKSLDVETVFQNQTLRVPLILGSDLLPRNNLKRLEDNLPRIHLVLWASSPQVFRYMCIIQCDDAVGIWSNYYANRLIRPA